MKQKAKNKATQNGAPEISKQAYQETLYKLRVELVKFQKHLIECNDKILIILEGRDASGKDGTIKRIIKHLSPRETRVVALGKPSTAIAVPGTSSATCPISPQPRNWCCSTAVGTTAPASSG